MSAPNKQQPIVLTPALLRRWPLPLPAENADKEGRGRILVVGGSAQTPGAVILALEAALRAGAGKARAAVGKSLAPSLALAVPEARLFALPETEHGEIAPEAAAQIVELAGNVSAVVFGPGMIEEDNAAQVMQAVLPHLSEATVVLDAAAMTCVRGSEEWLHPLQGRAILTPHAGEMATLLGVPKEQVTQEPASQARETAARLQAILVLKGRETAIAAPSGALYLNRAGNSGLATSGSGDVLAGLIGGLAARGAEPVQAAAWGVALHARAGDVLARRIGPLGYLARELAAEAPALMQALTAAPRQQRRSSSR